MENQEFKFEGTVLNGFLMLFINLAMLILPIVGIVYSIIMLDASNGAQGGWLLGGSILLVVINIIMWCGMLQLEPNEARVTTWFGINYLAYAPEIAAVMLRRQQASAIITAREKIVEGAVSMVKMALDKLSSEEIVELDDDKKAAMVSNLLVVLCGDESAQPVVNTGTLNH